MRVTKKAVIETASALIDQKGLNQISLKDVAEALGIRTPSLYNHINSLDEMLQEVAHAGMAEMNDLMTKSSIGKISDEAIKAVSAAYLKYMIEHPGIYETIQWASWHQTEETTALLNQFEALLMALIRSCGYDEAADASILRLLTGLLHGYTTIQLRYAFDEPERVTKELTDAVDTVLTGVRIKYQK
ncbi:MAG: TetR/AcrR family transcriptional regulator [bacterium]|nr:TetR/AcrR family transcriptional regulator [bacterium]